MWKLPFMLEVDYGGGAWGGGSVCGVGSVCGGGICGCEWIHDYDGDV